MTDDTDRSAFRADLGIPDRAGSCHAAMVEGYALEGHVPVGAIERLLSDRPDAVGLALRGMPADSPGMARVARPPSDRNIEDVGPRNDAFTDAMRRV